MKDFLYTQIVEMILKVILYVMTVFTKHSNQDDITFKEIRVLYKEIAELKNQLKKKDEINLDAENRLKRLEDIIYDFRERSAKVKFQKK